MAGSLVEKDEAGSDGTYSTAPRNTLFHFLEGCIQQGYDFFLKESLRSCIVSGVGEFLRPAFLTASCIATCLGLRYTR